MGACAQLPRCNAGGDLGELMPAVSDVETQLRDAEERIWGTQGY